MRRTKTPPSASSKSLLHSPDTSPTHEPPLDDAGEFDAFAAAADDDVYALRRGVRRGFDPYAAHPVTHQPLLHVAAAAGAERYVRALLEFGAALEQRDADGRTALHIAARHAHSGTVRMLIAEMGADCEARDADGVGVEGAAGHTVSAEAFVVASIVASRTKLATRFRWWLVRKQLMQRGGFFSVFIVLYWIVNLPFLWIMEGSVKLEKWGELNRAEREHQWESRVLPVAYGLVAATAALHLLVWLRDPGYVLPGGEGSADANIVGGDGVGGGGGGGGGAKAACRPRQQSSGGVAAEPEEQAERTAAAAAYDDDDPLPVVRIGSVFHGASMGMVDNDDDGEHGGGAPFEATAFLRRLQSGTGEEMDGGLSPERPRPNIPLAHTTSGLDESGLVLSFRSGDGAPRWCPSCALWKEPRTKHCRICKRCVRRFDHHCPWMGNCIGQRNLRWFYFFLLGGTVNAACVLTLCILLVVAYSQNDPQQPQNIPLSCGNASGAYKEGLCRPGALVAMATISFLTLLGIGALLIQHTNQVCRNRTTNEQILIKRRKGGEEGGAGCSCSNFIRLLCGRGT